jgi:uncharacterized repeat protein (TIGR01451 family)
VSPGEEIEFEIVVTNLSEVTAYTVTIRDQLPAGFIYIEESARSRDVPIVDLDDKDPLVWVLEDLEPQKSIRLTYKAALDPTLEEGLYTTAVNVYAMDRSGFQFGTNEFELDVKVERTIVVDMTQRIPEQEEGKVIPAGEPFTVITAIENLGSDNLLDGTVMVTLPEGMDYIPESSRINGVAIGEPVRDGQTVTWKPGELPAGGQKTLQYMLYNLEGISGKHSLITEIRGTTGTGRVYQSKKHTIEVNYSY